MRRNERTSDRAGRFELIGSTPGGGLALQLSERLRAACVALESEPWAWELVEMSAPAPKKAHSRKK